MRIDLAPEDVEIVRGVLEERLHDLSIEINRTDSIDYRAELRKTERAVRRLLEQLTAAPAG